VDQHLFEITQVPMHVPPVRFEVEDGIAHELTGTMVRDVPPSSYEVELDPPGASLVLGQQYVPCVGGASKGDDGRVFKEEELIGDPSFSPAGHEAFL
jgi:hypothetical protein